MYVASIRRVIAGQYNKTTHCMYVASICRVLPRQSLYCMYVASIYGATARQYMHASLYYHI
jgi:hypothetical protein